MEAQAQLLFLYSFVDRDMFMRYLGGGIGHLEQFPPADNDSEDTIVDTDGCEETEEINVDNPIGDPNVVMVCDDSDASGDDGDEHVEEDEDEDEDMEGDEDEEDNDLDPGGSSDEETGNVY